MREQQSYWQGVEARLLPAAAVGLAGAAGVWLVDRSVGTVALVFVFLVALLSAALLPPR
jgi:hypothetical protein